jgi:L-ascorbate metabolism protein UlaG (beta-lactamase superfamily)
MSLPRPQALSTPFKSDVDQKEEWSMNSPLYLRPNVKAEPLVDGWYAWTHLIPPATAARNLTERHLKIMDSYIECPEAHEAAVQDPAMVGGPFMDLGRNREDDIKALREYTIRNRKDLIELSHAIEELDAMLRAKAVGYGVEELYAEVPPCLQGFVEIVYDLNNQPSFRLIEPLLYRSALYDDSLQTVMLAEITGDDRPFVFSTPRVDKGNAVQLQIPFAAGCYDHLFRMKREPATFTAIRDLFELTDKDAAVFRAFFTNEPPRSYADYRGPGARWRYFGHACILVEAGGTSVLLDPVLSYTYESDISRYTYDDLPEFIDFVLITHNHQDHVLFETLLQLRHRIRTIVVPRNGGGALQDPSLRLLLRQCGFLNVIELPEMEEINFPNGSITAVPFLGEHADLNVLTKAAYRVRLANHRLLFLADSCNISPKLYEHIHCALGDADVIFLGMECDGAPLSWLYGPLLTQKLERSKDQSRRLAGSNYDRAMAMVERLKCKEVYVYAMGQEPWLKHVMGIRYTEKSNPIIESNRLVETCRARGIKAERLFGEREILLP